jgi:hypothetical protein
MIGALGSPFRPHPESDLVIDLYFGSIPIAIIDESNRRISFNRLNKFMMSLLVVIKALGSPSGSHPESDLATDLYPGSTPIANMDMFDHRISFNRLNKSAISLLAVTGHQALLYDPI